MDETHSINGNVEEENAPGSETVDQVGDEQKATNKSYVAHHHHKQVLLQPQERTDTVSSTNASLSPPYVSSSPPQASGSQWNPPVEQVFVRQQVQQDLPNDGKKFASSDDSTASKSDSASDGSSNTNNRSVENASNEKGGKEASGEVLDSKSASMAVHGTVSSNNQAVTTSGDKQGDKEVSEDEKPSYEDRLTEVASVTADGGATGSSNNQAIASTDAEQAGNEGAKHKLIQEFGANKKTCREGETSPTTTAPVAAAPTFASAAPFAAAPFAAAPSVASSSNAANPTVTTTTTVSDDDSAQKPPAKQTIDGGDDDESGSSDLTSEQRSDAVAEPGEETPASTSMEVVDQGHDDNHHVAPSEATDASPPRADEANEGASEAREGEAAVARPSNNDAQVEEDEEDEEDEENEENEEDEKQRIGSETEISFAGVQYAVRFTDIGVKEETNKEGEKRYKFLGLKFDHKPVDDENAGFTKHNMKRDGLLPLGMVMEQTPAAVARPLNNDAQVEEDEEDKKKIIGSKMIVKFQCVKFLVKVTDIHVKEETDKEGEKSYEFLGLKYDHKRYGPPQWGGPVDEENGFTKHNLKADGFLKLWVVMEEAKKYKANKDKEQTARKKRAGKRGN